VAFEHGAGELAISTMKGDGFGILKRYLTCSSMEVTQPFYAFRGLVVASPVWYPNISLDTRRKLFNVIKNVLEAKTFEYKEVDGYFER
jgi:hypothetical protein